MQVKVYKQVAKEVQTCYDFYRKKVLKKNTFYNGGQLKIICLGHISLRGLVEMAFVFIKISKTALNERHGHGKHRKFIKSTVCANLLLLDKGTVVVIANSLQS